VIFSVPSQYRQTTNRPLVAPPPTWTSSYESLTEPVLTSLHFPPVPTTIVNVNGWVAYHCATLSGLHRSHSSSPYRHTTETGEEDDTIETKEDEDTEEDVDNDEGTFLSMPKTLAANKKATDNPTAIDVDRTTTMKSVYEKELKGRTLSGRRPFFPHGPYSPTAKKLTFGT
jgi:hypothetical protein